MIFPDPLPSVVLSIPFLLIPTTLYIFVLSTRKLGKEMGYLLGFLFYWMVWCIVLPWALVGTHRFLSFFVDKAPLLSQSNGLVAVLWAIITLVTLLMYGRSFMQASLPLILIAIPAATINGICEEVLWRGLFVTVFPNNLWLAILYPSIGFALWHFVPLSVFSEGNKWSFVLSTFFLGLAYGCIAYRTGSILWTTISHSLNGILALSGMIAPSILKLPTQGALFGFPRRRT